MLFSSYFHFKLSRLYFLLEIEISQITLETSSTSEEISVMEGKFA